MECNKLCVLFNTECDGCIHLLLDEIDFMEYNLTAMIYELDSVSVGVNTLKRLNKINSTVYELRVCIKSSLNMDINSYLYVC